MLFSWGGWPSMRARNIPSTYVPSARTMQDSVNMPVVLAAPERSTVMWPLGSSRYHSFSVICDSIPRRTTGWFASSSVLLRDRPSSDEIGMIWFLAGGEFACNLDEAGSGARQRRYRMAHLVCLSALLADDIVCVCVFVCLSDVAAGVLQVPLVLRDLRQHPQEDNRLVRLLLSVAARPPQQRRDRDDLVFGGR